MKEVSQKNSKTKNKKESDDFRASEKRKNHPKE